MMARFFFFFCENENQISHPLDRGVYIYYPTKLGVEFEVLAKERADWRIKMEKMTPEQFNKKWSQLRKKIREIPKRSTLTQTTLCLSS